jgi:hypothetical protein
MTRTPPPLPRSLAPLPDESLPGFLLRLAHRLDLAPLRVAEATGMATSVTTARIPARFLLALDPDTAVRFAAATRLGPAEAHALTLATLRGTYPPVDPAFGFHRRHGGVTGRTVNGVFVQERWILADPAATAPRAWPGTAASSSSVTAAPGTNSGTCRSCSPAPPTNGSSNTRARPAPNPR